MAEGQDVIDDFMGKYEKEYKVWEKIAETTANICQDGVKGQKVPPVVTKRVKRHESLKDKLFKVNEERKENGKGFFKTINDIYKAIADFAGVRIAFHFPHQAHTVEHMIKRNFEVLKMVSHTGRKTQDSGDVAERPDDRGEKFPGYVAKHYRVRVPQYDKSAGQLEADVTPLAEIQVMSASFQNWSEIEHDIGYKPHGGELSLITNVMLDTLNGLVRAAENIIHTLYISQTKDALARNPQNDFLESFALTIFLRENPAYITRLSSASIDVLWEFLDRFAKRTPETLTPVLERLRVHRDSPTFQRYREMYLPTSDGCLDIMLQVLHDEGLATPGPSQRGDVIRRMLRKGGDGCLDKKAVESRQERCYIVLSALLWLLNLFGAHQDFEAFWSRVVGGMGDGQRAAFRWATDKKDRMAVLKASPIVEPASLQTVDVLWDWCVDQLNRVHGDCVIGFVFGLAFLGVRRDFTTNLTDYGRLSCLYIPEA